MKKRVILLVVLLLAAVLALNCFFTVRENQSAHFADHLFFHLSQFHEKISKILGETAQKQIFIFV